MGGGMKNWIAKGKFCLLFDTFYLYPIVKFPLKIKQAGQLTIFKTLIICHFSDKFLLQLFFRRKLYKLRLLWMSSSTWMFPSTLSLIGSRQAIQRKEFLKNFLFLLFRFGIWAQKSFLVFDWYFAPCIRIQEAKMSRILRTALKNSFMFNEFSLIETNTFLK